MSIKLQVYSVFDSKAEVFGTPMFFQTAGIATRAFGDECNRTESELHKHPEDYTLFHIGEFIQDTGLMVPLKTPASLGLAIEYKKEA
jgi:hypothetical protein